MTNQLAELKEQVADIINEAIDMHSDTALCSERSDYAGNKPYDQTEKILALIQAYGDERERLALNPANGLLRSAYEIAKRNGNSTNWEAFRKRLMTELQREHKVMYPPTNPAKEQE